MRDSCDVLVLGAGPTGCCLALALLGSGLSVSVLERRPRAAGAPHAPGPALAGRAIALSQASRLILERLGAWPGVLAAGCTPIESIRVSRQGFGRTRLDAADAGVPALGYVVGYEALAAALVRRAQEAGVGIAFDVRQQSCGPQDAAVRVHASVAGTQREFVARCVVHAEGTADAIEKNYGHEALVALVTTEPAARTTAFERFTAQGPMAMLPMDGRYALIWGMQPERAAGLVDAEAAVFLGELAGAFGARAGRLVAVQDRGRVQLGLRVRPSRVGHREAFIGNAAQTLHPVAGQGLNLGLRDAWELAVALHGVTDPGDAAFLRRYAAARRLDAGATVRVTDMLAGGFLGANPLGGAARGLLMTALDTLAPARRFFARRMIFGPSAVP